MKLSLPSDEPKQEGRCHKQQVRQYVYYEEDEDASLRERHLLSSARQSLEREAASVLMSYWFFQSPK